MRRQYKHRDYEIMCHCTYQKLQEENLCNWLLIVCFAVCRGQIQAETQTKNLMKITISNHPPILGIPSSIQPLPSGHVN